MKYWKLYAFCAAAIFAFGACGTSQTAKTTEADTLEMETVFEQAEQDEDIQQIAVESIEADSDKAQNNGKKESSDKSKKGSGSGKEKPDGSNTGKGKSESGSKKGKASGKKDASDSSGEETSYDTSAQNAATVLNNGDTLTGGTYTATEPDESAIEASGNVTATVTGAVINKESGNATSADDSSFKGINAGVRVYGNANVTLTDCDITASAQNATGVFAYDNGVITLYDCTVSVTGGGAGGVQVAGGGTLYGYNLNVTSASKAAIRSDRGGGILVIDGGTYTSTGSNGCPAIYSTADITVRNADCISTSSRAVIIEGKNSVTLENCTVSGNDQSTKEGSIRANVLLYQSASGDASVGTSEFTMTGGSMTSGTGAMFYCTNTASVITLEDAELILSDDGTLLIVSAGRWGKDGKNGGDCIFNAKNQTLEGLISVDNISELELNLTEGSDFTGSIELTEGDVSVTIDDSSTWTLTADSYVSSFSGNAAGIISNGYTLYVNGTALTGTN